MASHYEAPIRRPLIAGEKSYHDVSVDVAAPVEGKANKSWWIVFTLALTAFLWGIGCIIYTISTGIGTWGLNKTVGWAWDITNFVWSRRDPDFCCTFIIPSKMENGCKPFC